jgi:hypothetical protein
MPFVTLTGGLALVIPTSGTTNWGPTLLTSTWQKINDHGHTGSGDGNLITKSAIVPNSLDKDSLAKNLDLTQAATLTPAGTTQTIDWDTGNIQQIDLSSATGDVTLTFNNAKTGAYYTLLIDQGATVRKLLWPVNVLWEAGSDGEPTQFADVSSKAVVWLHSDGANFRTIYSVNQS